MKNLKTLSEEELRTFFDSFDLVLCDGHGVLFNVLGEIPGSCEASHSLQKIGKRFVVVSNNTLDSPKNYISQKLKKFHITEDNIVTPIGTTIHYLKKQKFSGKVFLLGSDIFKDCLRDEGFQVRERGPLVIAESFKAFVEASDIGDDDISAVIVDTDVNLNYVNLELAHGFLKNPKVLFLKGGIDYQFPLGNGRNMIAAGYFQRILEEMTGRVGVALGKPSTFLREYVIEKYNVTDASRVLFIGDSVEADMAFAANCGYQKLLVFTGLTKQDCVQKWEYPNEFKPDFYVDSLKSLHETVEQIFNK